MTIVYNPAKQKIKIKKLRKSHAILLHRDNHCQCFDTIPLVFFLFINICVICMYICTHICNFSSTSFERNSQHLLKDLCYERSIVIDHTSWWFKLLGTSSPEIELEPWLARYICHKAQYFGICPGILNIKWGEQSVLALPVGVWKTLEEPGPGGYLYWNSDHQYSSPLYKSNSFL